MFFFEYSYSNPVALFVQNVAYRVAEFEYSKTCLKRPLKKKTDIGFQDRLSINAGPKYCRMLMGSILQYFRPSLNYHLSLISLFCLFLSGRLRQVSLYCKFGNFREGFIFAKLRPLVANYERRKYAF